MCINYTYTYICQRVSDCIRNICMEWQNRCLLNLVATKELPTVVVYVCYVNE